MSQWSSKVSRNLSVILLSTLILTTAVPSTNAGDPPEPDPAMVDFYVADGSLTLEAPTTDVTQSGSMLATATTPAAATRALWGGMTLDGPIQFETNMVATLWLEPEEATVIRQIRASILSNEDRVAFGDIAIIGSSGESVFTEARKIQIGIPTQGLEVSGDIALEFSLWATGVAGSPTDVQLLYGSTTHPSRLSAGVSQDSLGQLAHSGFARTYYLDDEALTAEPPTDEESRARSHGVTGLDSLATAAGFEWGAITIDEDLELIGDTTLTFWLTHSGDPAIMRTLRPEVHFGETTVTQSGGIAVWQFVDGETYRFDIAFDTAGMEIPAGTQIQVDFIAWSSNSDEVGLIEYLYGSTVHPAGLTLRAAGDPPGADGDLPALNLSTESTDLEISAGNETQVQVDVENADQVNAMISWNITSQEPVSVVPVDGEELELSGEDANATFTVRLTETAETGTSHTVNLSAEIDGVSVATLTLTVHVVSGLTPGGDDDEHLGNHTMPGGEDDIEEKGSVPGPGAVALLLIALVGGVWARHRRTRR